MSEGPVAGGPVDPARRRIVAIGGGELGRGETLALDRRIVEAVGRDRPRALFLPTASGDEPSYGDAFRAVYGDRLGCECEVLELVRAPPSPAALAARVADAELVYVGGGNTRAMLKAWRAHGLDQLLVRAWQRGTVMAGLSAGALCWFARAGYDSIHFARDGMFKLGHVAGLGLLAGAAAPHTLKEPARLDGLAAMMLDLPGLVGIGLDDGLALEVEGPRFRIRAAFPLVKLHRIYWGAGGLVREALAPDPALRPLADLLEPRPFSPG